MPSLSFIIISSQEQDKQLTLMRSTLEHHKINKTYLAKWIEVQFEVTVTDKNADMFINIAKEHYSIQSYKNFNPAKENHNKCCSAI